MDRHRRKKIEEARAAIRAREAVIDLAILVLLLATAIAIAYLIA